MERKTQYVTSLGITFRPGEIMILQLHNHELRIRMVVVNCVTEVLVLTEKI